MAVGKLSWTDPRSRTSRRGRFRTRVTRSAHNRTRPRIAGPATAYRDALSSISFSLFFFSPPPFPSPLTEFTRDKSSTPSLLSKSIYRVLCAPFSDSRERYFRPTARISNSISSPLHFLLSSFVPSHSSRIYIHKFSPGGFVTDGNGWRRVGMSGF